MGSLLCNVSDLNDMILQGKSLEAFEQFYHSDVVMQENNNPATIGKEANRLREIAFFNAVTEFRTTKVLKVALGENNTTMVEWQLDYTHKEYGDCNITQVAVQQWQDGLIINEKFYYAP